MSSIPKIEKILFTTTDPSKKFPTDIFVSFTTVDPSKKLTTDVFVLFTTTVDLSKKLTTDHFVLFTTAEEADYRCLVFFTTVEEAHYRCFCIVHNCKSQQEAHKEVSVHTGNQKCLHYFRW